MPRGEGLIIESCHSLRIGPWHTTWAGITQQFHAAGLAPDGTNHFAEVYDFTPFCPGPRPHFTIVGPPVRLNVLSTEEGSDNRHAADAPPFELFDPEPEPPKPEPGPEPAAAELPGLGVDRAGRSPLHLAAAGADFAQLGTLLSGTPRLAEQLLVPDKVGDLPLHHAARAGSIECSRALLEAQPAQLDVQSKKGDTPLILAACWGHTEVAEMLIGAGADQALTTRNGWTAQKWAAKFARDQNKQKERAEGAKRAKPEPQNGGAGAEGGGAAAPGEPPDGRAGDDAAGEAREAQSARLGEMEQAAGAGLAAQPVRVRRRVKRLTKSGQQPA